MICALAIRLKYLLKIDDALDVGAVHFVGGLLGALLIGFFGTTAVNSAGANGLLHGGGLSLLGKQALAVAVVTVYSFVMSWLIAMAIKKTMGLRISEEAEDQGMDLSLHAEAAYEFAPSYGGGQILSSRNINEGGSK